jgi:para-aminobenzoate synthetase component 1
MIRYIIDGDIYIANMTRRIHVKSRIDPYEFFCRLRRENPSPFGAYLDYGHAQIICASPERFLLLKDGLVSTRPIKGTRPRGKTPPEDEALRQELIDSEKDRSELLMIVDLERNDLSRVCELDSVEVTELFALEEYATVFHLVSTVKGRLASDNDVCDLLESAFPGGSITGAPKHRAIQIIDELENSARGLYTGSIGYIGLDGSCDMNIVIRTAVFDGSSYEIGVGGGITAESDVIAEYDETSQKAKALLSALEALR